MIIARSKLWTNNTHASSLPTPPNQYPHRYIATIGVDYGVKPHTVNGQQVRVNFWDLSGLPEFFEVRNEFYKDTQGLILVYDVSDAQTFDDLDGWVAEAQTGAVPGTSPPVDFLAHPSAFRTPSGRVFLISTANSRAGPGWTQAYWQEPGEVRARAVAGELIGPVT